MTSSHPPHGFQHLPGYFDASAQTALLRAALEAIAAAGAPFYQPRMPRTGQPLSVWMTNFGPLGWMTDKAKGYRYEPLHPDTGRPWPAMPQALLDLWNAVADYPAQPEACLVNWYGPKAKMGLHKDWDEEATDAAVVSVSLGDAARFRLGGPTRRGATQSLQLESGDVVVLGGAARGCYHGVDRIFPGTSTLFEAIAPALWTGAGLGQVLAAQAHDAPVEDGLFADAPGPTDIPSAPRSGRINLTLRRVTRPAAATAQG